jgi:GNAT superfamily N-acetyltransferase
MSVRIRIAVPADFERLVDLLRQLWPGKELDRKRLLAVFNQMMFSDVYRMVCAENGGTVIGFCSTAILDNFWQEGPVLYITTMIVDEKHRGQGIGTALINEIEKIARERGCKRIELESAFHRTETLVL